MTTAGGRRLAHAIRRSTARGRPALAPFLTAGFPTREGFAGSLRRVAAEAEIVEIGVPFTDPMADGATIQRSSRAALAAGVDLTWILRTLGETPVPAPLLLMSYLNPLLSFGLERLAAASRGAGIAGMIVPDLPIEESPSCRDALAAHGMALIRLVTPVTPDERLERIGRAADGFLYAVTSTGTTGGSAGAGSALGSSLARVRRVSPVPVLAGFGVRTAEQLDAIATVADGAVVGSALIETLERDGDPVAFLRGLRRIATRRKEMPA